jgi:hypothetical protein
MAIGTGAGWLPIPEAQSRPQQLVLTESQKQEAEQYLSVAKNRLVMVTVNAAFGPNVQIMVAQYHYEGWERAKNCWRDGSELAELRGGIIRGGGLRRGLRVGR